ncbi:MAG: glycosyltransferase [Pseudohongiella sp.]|uniref:glycosyltransferase n=1 Tax=Pseudohongiella sp. TaxID=1979412 RepID=UPI0034A01CA4
MQELTPFWNKLSEPADIPVTHWAGGISRLLLLAVSVRQDLTSDPNLVTIEGQKTALLWFFSSGWQELGLTREDVPNWQRQFWLDQDDICNTRFARFLHEQRLDLQQAFDLQTEQGADGYRHWLTVNAISETILPLLQQPPVEPGPSVHSADTAYPFGVNLVGYAFGELGLGEDLRMAAQALEARGIPFTVINLPPGNNIPENDRTIAHWVTDSARYSITLVCLTALEHLDLYLRRGAELFAGRYTIGSWPWELQRWPGNWHHCFQLVDEVWASSKHIYDAVKAAAPVPVEYMPMAVTLPAGLDSAAPAQRLQFNLPNGKYLFVFSFDGNSFIERKNPQAIVQAFQQAFPVDEQQVGLVVKCMRPDVNSPAWQKILHAAHNDPRITIIDETLTKLEVMELYRSCNCFVSLHRAEGFGRGIAEALLLGLEVIATGHGGNRDFCEQAGAYLVNYTLQPLDPGDYVEAAGQVWAEPDIDDAAKAMRAAFDEWLTNNVFHGAEQSTLDSLFSASAVGERYSQRLYEIQQEFFD